MFRYIYANPKVLKRFEGIKIWIPSAIVRFPECRPKDLFLFDCFISTLVSDPYIRILLIKKLPRNVKILEEPSVQAPKLQPYRCSGSDIISDLLSVRNEISLGVTDRIDELVERLTQPRDIEITARLFLFRRRKFTISADRIRRISREIAYESIKAVLKGLCIDTEATPLSPRIEALPVYVLMVLDPEKAFAGIVIDKHIEISTSHLNIVLSMEEVYNEILKAVGPV